MCVDTCGYINSTSWTTAFSLFAKLGELYVHKVVYKL